MSGRMEGSGVVLEPTERSVSLAEQIYRRLRNAIITGGIRPGSRLREVELAAMLAVSRTPLREAVARLVGDRLVRSLPQGGVEVVDVNSERADIHEIRVSLECSAARLAAQRITAAELTHLTLLIKQRAALPIEAVNERLANNSAFHDCIRHASRSPRLVDMIDGYREFFVDAAGLSQLDEADSRRAAAEHRHIVTALQAGDPDRADQLVRRHLELAFRSLARAAPDV
jgi:DNA-binding GntR family transcriptional regulator